MGCIMTPMPNYLSTCLSLFYYSSFDEWGVWRTPLQNNKNHTKQCGKGSDVQQMRRMVRSVGEMVRIKVEKGYMTTPSVDEEKVEKARGEQ